MSLKNGGTFGILLTHMMPLEPCQIPDHLTFWTVNTQVCKTSPLSDGVGWGDLITKVLKFRPSLIISCIRDRWLTLSLPLRIVHLRSQPIDEIWDAEESCLVGGAGGAFGAGVAVVWCHDFGHASVVQSTIGDGRQIHIKSRTQGTPQNFCRKI